MTREEFFSKWTREVEALRRRGALVNGADFCAELLADVRAVFEADEGELLTLAVAAARSGYSVDHLGRLLREGVIPNAGRPHSPRIRVRDLPRKPKGSLAETAVGPYDPLADARTLLSRQRGGRHA
jgi:hypothetical protein